MTQPLPIDPLLPEALDWLTPPGANLVLAAEPGAGKTTRLPAALLKAGFMDSREIWVLEPRRLAARAAAQRVAWELGEEPGARAGYQFRFEKVAGPSTRLKFMTEGMLLRLAQSDRDLRRVGAVVLDEFHERSLSTDLNLAWLRKLQATARPDLRLVVMSATLDPGPVAEYLGRVKVMRSTGRQFPVALEYQPFDAKPRLEDKVAAALDGLARRGLVSEAVLVFLPGRAEILRCQGALQAMADSRGWELLPLYADLPQAAQARVLEPSGKPRVILSTNVAETSLTLPGVLAVIDSGLARRPSVSWWSGLSTLRVVPVSQASAIQRAGRAGRTDPGLCVRLYSKFDFEHRQAFDTEEIRRSDLSRGLLDLYAAGGMEGISFLQPPSAEAMQASLELLRLLGAVEHGGLSGQGKAMAGLPLHPRLGRFLMEASALGARDRRTEGEVLAWACRLAAMASEEDFEQLDVWAQARGYKPEGASRSMEQSLRQAFGAGPRELSGQPGAATVELLQKALLAGFPDRVARVKRLGTAVSRNRSGRSMELLLATGGSALVDPAGLPLEAEFVVLLEASGTPGSDAVLKARSLSAVQADWLLDYGGDLCREETMAWWDAESERVRLARKLMYGKLVLDETELPPSSDAAEAGRILRKAALEAGAGAFLSPAELDRLKGRCETAARASGLVLEPADFGTVLGEVCEGLSSFKELKRLDWGPLFLAADQRRLLDQWAPAAVELKGGRRLTVQYAPGAKPWVESRLQDFFGMAEGPVLGKGKVPLVIHLLAPNKRPVQVTSDLKGFWERHYAPLRRELMRKYPKHKWPENPLA